MAKYPSPKTPKQLKDALQKAEELPEAEGGSPGPATALAAICDASALPTSDPLVAGQLWNNAGIVTVSSGV